MLVRDCGGFDGAAAVVIVFARREQKRRHRDGVAVAARIDFVFP